MLWRWQAPLAFTVRSSTYNLLLLIPLAKEGGVSKAGFAFKSPLAMTPPHYRLHYCYITQVNLI
jgi:hypothetical protein